MKHHNPLHSQSLRDILTSAVSEAISNEPDPDRLDWGAYWEPARELWERGWSWSRIFEYFDARLRAQGLRMPGDVGRFSRAMSARKRVATGHGKRPTQKSPYANQPAVPGRMLPAVAAERLGFSTRKLWEWMQKQGWLQLQRADEWISSEMAIREGWLQHKNRRTKFPGGTWGILFETYVTPAGLAKLQEDLPKASDPARPASGFSSQFRVVH